MVTGSTSRIGLSIARALTTAGADVMLNGLCDPREVEKLPFQKSFRELSRRMV